MMTACSVSCSNHAISNTYRVYELQNGTVRRWQRSAADRRRSERRGSDWRRRTIDHQLRCCAHQTAVQQNTTDQTDNEHRAAQNYDRRPSLDAQKTRPSLASESGRYI